jgi:glycosyltransferase involved in cell wall biosynthesis
MTTSAAPYRIAIDSRCLVRGYNGYVTYLTSIIEPLLTAGWEITLLTNQPLDPVHHFIAQCQVVVFGPAGSLRWEQFSLPAYLRAHPFDLYFAPTNRGIPWRHVPVRTILGLLDVIPFLFWRTYFFRHRLHFLRRELLPQLISIHNASAIITISEHSAGDISRLFRSQEVTPLLIRLPSTKPHREAAQDQFAYVGGVDPRKRVDVLLKAFALFREQHSSYRLVLIGHGFNVFDRLIQSLNLQSSVVQTGYVSEPEKMKLLGQSRALIYPSRYEGYGLAIAEGLQAGTLVIAGAGGAQAEIGGDAVRYIDPLDPRDITRAMSELLDPKIALKLQTESKRQLARLTNPLIEDKIIDYFTHQAELARGQS